MSVNDVSLFRIQPEFPDNIIAHRLTNRFVFNQSIIRILPFLMGILFAQEIPLEGRHLFFAEHR